MTWDPARFFPAFQRAGMLHTARYQPRFGATKEFCVDFRQPNTLVLDGRAQSTDYEIEFETSAAPDLDDAGGLIEVCGQQFTLRQPVERLGNGFYSRAVLALVGR